MLTHSQRPPKRSVKRPRGRPRKLKAPGPYPYYVEELKPRPMQSRDLALINDFHRIFTLTQPL